MEPLWIQVPDVAAIEENFALLWVVEALHEGDDGGFAAARGAAKRHDAVLLVVNGEGDALEDLHIWPTRVAELDILQFNSSIDFALDNVATTALDIGLVVHQLDDLVRCADNCSYISKDVGNHAEGEDKHGEVEQKGGHRTNGELVSLVKFHANDHHSAHRAVKKTGGQQTVNGRVDSLLAASLVYNIVSCVESADFRIFVAEGAHSPDVGEGLLGDGIHLSLLSLNLTLKRAHAFLIESREDDEGDDAGHSRAGQGW